MSLLITGTLFILWDEAFTQQKVWGFNAEFITGLYIGSLPIEEILFFICIPYACVFTYFTLNNFVAKDHLFPHQELISSGLIVLLLISGIYNIEKWYTGLTFVVLALFLAYQMLKIRPRYMGRFYFAFAVLLVPFFIINGILTGSFLDSQVVWYNEAHILGIRIGTIPIEDVFYGFFLILLNIAIMEWLEDRAYYKKK